MTETDDFDGTVCFILDAETRVEKAILDRYLRESEPSSQDVNSIRVNFRSAKNASKNFDSIESAISQTDSQFFIPLRVVWHQKKIPVGDSGLSIRDLLLGRDGNPGKFRQRWLHRGFKLPGETPTYEVICGKGASLKQLTAYYKKKSPDGDLSQFIARSAFLVLERAERTIKGARYKVPVMVDDEVLGNPQLREVLNTLSKKTGRSIEALKKEAGACLKEMAATPTPAGLDLAAALGRYMYTRGFDKKIDFADGDLDRVRTLLGERPVAFLFTHKSHIDGFLLITLFHDLNFPPVHTFGGINMGFLGLGTLLRNAGAIFIRRSFKGDEIYKAVFKSYIDYLGEKRFPVMWALEGTRSRTGKLMPPRFGLINYVVSAYLRDEAPDLLLMPISIVYDQIPEVSDYDALQAGGEKTPESVSWFMQYLSGLKNPHGKIHVRFGQGIQISDFIDLNAGLTSVDRRDMQKIAFELAVDANKATPITINSLICYVLLEQGHRAITLNQLNKEIQKLQNFIAIFNFPMTSDAHNLTPEILDKALKQLSVTGVITIAEDGVEVIYMIPHGTARTAAYYRNGLIQFFITSAIGEVALLAVTEEGGGAIDQFHQEALRIRDVLKYEFFFEGSDEFIKSLEREFDARMGDWRSTLRLGKKAIHKMLRSMNLILGHGTLRPFIESYLVFAKVLSLLPENDDVQASKLISSSLALGKQRVLQQRIHCEESVSQSYFENGVKIAEGRELFEKTEVAVSGRQQLLQELRNITSNVRFLASISETQRLAERMATQNDEL